jgi:hypothetical protein
MGLQTWSGLQKDSTDDQTIAQAIQEAIDNHNADPEAHGEPGEALYLHKTDDVIDHPKGSVKGDKISDTEIIFDIPFQSLDGIEYHGDVSVNLGQGILVDVTAGTYSANNFYVTIPGDGAPRLPHGVDWTFQVPFMIDSLSSGKFRIGPEYYASTTPHGLIFYFDGTHLKALSTLTGYSYTSASITFDPSVLHVYRIQYETVDGFVRWYIDGFEVASFDLSGYTGGIADSLNFEFDIGGASEFVAQFPKVYFSRAL